MRYWLCGAATTKNWAPSKSLSFQPLSKVDRHLKIKNFLFFSMKEVFDRNQLSHFLLFNNNFSGRNLKIEGGDIDTDVR